jgi:SPP1 gp7 family putative phage head morphogenesis protein
MATSEALIQTTVRHQVLLERLKSGEVNRFTKFLKQIDSDLKERLLNDDLTNFSRTRLERLLVEVENALSGVFGEFQQELEGGLSDLAEYEAGFEAASIDDALESFESVVPASSQVRAAIFSAPLSVRGAGGGKLLEPFIADWSTGEKTRVIGAIRQGVFEGQTNFQIIQAIRGTRANKYTDGILATTSRNAEAIVRTAVQHVSSVARFETWQENTAVVKGYKWVSTLDGRTSTQCRSLDGQVFKLGKGPKPPIHIRCRSTTVAELDERFNFLKEGAQRASKDGPVDSGQTYYEWLKTQSVEFQDEVLGKTRARLFRDGGLSAERFAALNLHRNFTPMTLEEMRRKEPLAFGKAFDNIQVVKYPFINKGKREFNKVYSRSIQGSFEGAKKVALGIVPDKFASGKYIAIEPTYIKHINNRHGFEKGGQVSVSQEDFTYLEQLMLRAGSLSSESPGRNGNERVKFKAIKGDVQYTVVMEHRKNYMALVTMWKKKVK